MEQINKALPQRRYKGTSNQRIDTKLTTCLICDTSSSHNSEVHIPRVGH